MLPLQRYEKLIMKGQYAEDIKIIINGQDAVIIYLQIM